MNSFLGSSGFKVQAISLKWALLTEQICTTRGAVHSKRVLNLITARYFAYTEPYLQQIKLIDIEIYYFCYRFAEGFIRKESSVNGQPGSVYCKWMESHQRPFRSSESELELLSWIIIEKRNCNRNFAKVTMQSCQPDQEPKQNDLIFLWWIQILNLHKVGQISWRVSSKSCRCFKCQTIFESEIHCVKLKVR